MAIRCKAAGLYGIDREPSGQLANVPGYIPSLSGSLPLIHAPVSFRLQGERKTNDEDAKQFLPMHEVGRPPEPAIPSVPSDV